MPALDGDVFVAEPAGNLVRRVDLEQDGVLLVHQPVLRMLYRFFWVLS